MNLSITGKKMNTPVPNKKNAEIASPSKQPKPLPQKPALQTKPKSTLLQPHKPVQPKKQEALKVESKKEAKKEEQPASKQETAPKAEEKPESEPKIEAPVQAKKEQVLGSVTVRYNHYKESFPTVNGLLAFLPIEEKYSFGSVFRGDYKPVLKPFRLNEAIVPETAGRAVEFTWRVEADKEYKLQIWEDEQQELKVEKRAYKAPQNDSALQKKNARFQELTEAMKKMDPKELGSEKHRQMLEQRDLEDVLFS